MADADVAPLTSLENLPLVLTVEEARIVMRIGRRQIYEAIKRCDLHAIRIGRSLRVPRASIRQWLEGQAKDGGERPQLALVERQ